MLKSLSASDSNRSMTDETDQVSPVSVGFRDQQLVFSALSLLEKVLFWDLEAQSLECVCGACVEKYTSTAVHKSH